MFYTLLLCLFFGLNDLLARDLTLSRLGVDFNPNDYQKSDLVQVDETEIMVNGIKLKQIEYKSEKYYFRFIDGTLIDPAEAKACEKIPKPQRPEQITMVLGETLKKNRPKLFIEGLKFNCNQTTSWSEFLTNLSQFKLGVILPESKDATITNKKIYINPLNLKSLNLSGEF